MVNGMYEANSALYGLNSANSFRINTTTVGDTTTTTYQMTPSPNAASLGVKAGAVIGGAVGGPIGVMVGALVGGILGAILG